MAFLQYEVWGVVDIHEELIECVPTLKEAEELVEAHQTLYDELWIIEDTDDVLKEVKRVQGL
jgi:hypothetical protein